LFTEVAVAAEGRKLVVFLTSSPQESMGILESVFAADSSAWLDFESIAIKMHQSVDNQLREQVEKRWPAIRSARVGWDGRPAGDILDEACLAVTGGSSVALEAVCRGVPVIVLGRSAGISFNILEDVDRQLWRLAYNAREFGQLVREWLPQLPDRSSRRETGRRVRDEHFEMTTPATMQAFDPRRIDKCEQRAIIIQS
jgi:hypothetical protein